MSQDTAPAHPLFAAIYDPAMAHAERTILDPHREYLADGLDGVVLDLGAGTGAMFPYFEGATVHAIEPDPHMRRRARDRTADATAGIELHDAGAADLPFPDDHFDAVVSSMVFCTVEDVPASIAEVRRVLRPGGEFRFLEHVADDGWRETVQTAVSPVWKRLAGGCHLTRRTASRFASESAFDVVEMDRFELGVTPVRPFVRGRLRKRQ
ncbi:MULTISPECIES: class I SAM-dependent methyltransferase [unclassified Halorhabdus]|uniref:class I SAM-dependent methyltransferase n=1 Tax=unclassified Halorhabdus TaxID=2621901 RepID=UPI0023DA18BD|nr:MULTISPECIES: class I SAM-dependent methyltransferase [unclassified Halorhabdus]WEL16247.1 SAM-dependent methyltransferase [Halorhabdus sp. SVX81]WEL20140.1 SAM-dependent methyltransferase [Halorhabdus sp. BNX81]